MINILLKFYLLNIVEAYVRAQPTQGDIHLSFYTQVFNLKHQ